MTVQEVVEAAELPEVGRIAYQVYQFPSRALLNPEREVTVLKNQEISIEPMQASMNGKEFSIHLCEYSYNMRQHLTVRGTSNNALYIGYCAFC